MCGLAMEMSKSNVKGQGMTEHRTRDKGEQSQEKKNSGVTEASLKT